MKRKNEVGLIIITVIAVILLRFIYKFDLLTEFMMNLLLLMVAIVFAVIWNKYAAKKYDESHKMRKVIPVLSIAVVVCALCLVIKSLIYYWLYYSQFFKEWLFQPWL